MANTLGLDDDLDGVEVVQDLEYIFDVKFSDEEVEHVYTVGDFHDLLLRKISPDDKDRKCASAMAFYRLRRALKKLGYGELFVPSSDLHFLEKGRTKSTLKRLAKESNLRFPKAAITALGGIGASICLLGVFLVGTYLHPGVSSAILSFFLGVAAAVFVLEYVDTGKLPRDCTTLAGLARKTAALSYGKLIKMGASHQEKDTWENLLEVLSVYALPKSEITRDTYFLQSQMKKKLVV